MKRRDLIRLLKQSGFKFVRQDLSGSLIGMNRMKNVYPVLIKQNGARFLAYVADIDSATQGDSFFEAIEMARDLLGSHSLVADLPAPGTAEQATAAARRQFDTDDFTISDGIMTFVDIDTVAYRKKQDDHCVRKNVSLPAWLSRKADEAGLSLSKVLQEALLERLG